MPPLVDDGFRSWRSYTIPAGATGLGPAVDLAGYRLSAIVLPSTWTTARITFQAEDPQNSGTFYDLFDDAAAEVVVASIAASKCVALVSTAAALLANRFIKIRSGISGTAVNQTSAPVLTLILDPMG